MDDDGELDSGVDNAGGYEDSDWPAEQVCPLCVCVCLCVCLCLCLSVSVSVCLCVCVCVRDIITFLESFDKGKHAQIHA